VNTMIEETEEENMFTTEETVPKKWISQIDRVLFTREEIAARVKEMGKEISESYGPDDEIIVVGMLKGAFMFLTDLVRELAVPNSIDFMIVSSYSGTESTGNVNLKKDISIDPYGKHVLIVEDLIDTGTTLQWLVKHLESKNCKSVKLCCLIDKVSGRPEGMGPEIDFIGFRLTTSDYIIGYGMDFHSQQFRSLPFVAVPTRQAIQNWSN